MNERLAARASDQPYRVLYQHLDYGPSEDEGAATSLTTGELWASARAVASALISRGAQAERVLLLYPPGLSFVPALLGSWLAGAVAVPAPAPSAHKPERALARLAGMAARSGASLVLAPESLLEQRPRLGPLSALPWLATDALPAAPADLALPSIGPDTLAYLQFTSGSTAEPRGVALTHRNLVQNCLDVQEAYAFDEQSVIASWVPTHHDLGLIYSVVMPLFVGFRSVTLSPEAFIGRPVRWLTALSGHRATHSVAPNFGFDLAVVRTRPEERRHLDLSSWRVALNGAEPIRRATEERFIETYAPFGFRAEALSHSYGLAEATAKVTAERPGRRRVFASLSAKALEQGQIAAPGPGERAVEIAGCGVPASSMRVAIVQPETGDALPEERLGEVWLQGGSVAMGYWADEAATEQIFQARLPGHEGYWLKTGDLGFLREGQLFIAGRSKDLIVVRGENHHPQDLEWAIQGRHPAIRPASAAAFSLERGEREAVVLVTDVYPEKVGEASAVFAAIREAVADHGLALDAIALTPPGTVPKTSSGKVQRGAARTQWRDGTLPLVASWEAPPDSPEPPQAPQGPIAELLRALPLADLAPLLEAHLCGLVAERLGLAPAEVAPEASLKALGIDSIAAVELGERLSQDLRLNLYPGVVQDHATVREVVAFVLQQHRKAR